MKILITTDWYAPAVNGVVTSVMNLIRELRRRGHDVRVLTLSRTKRSYEADGVTYIASVGVGRVYPGARVRTSPARGYVRELMAWKPEIIHSQCEFSTFLAAVKIAGKLDIPIVHTCHTVYEDYTHYFSPNRAGGRYAAAALSRWTAKHAASVIAPTEKVRAILESYRIGREIRVIPTGLDLSAFTSPVSPERLSALKRALGIPPGNRVLLFVGRLAREKNLEEILDCFAKLHPEGATLMLVGDGPHREALQTRARRLGVADAVVFTGLVPPDQVADYYRLGDLFVCASGSEAQGLTYIEALASGLPLLCRRDACLNGVVVEGQSGWQYDDEDDFTRKLALFMRGAGPKTERSEAGRLAAGHFSAAAFAESVESAYADALRFALGQH